jgi:hypothetical protein
MTCTDGIRAPTGPETSRITLPSRQVITIELRFGDSELHIADEFLDMGIVSPLTLGGTYGALHLAVDDVDSVWAKALRLAPPSTSGSMMRSGATGPVSSSTRSGTAGRSTNTFGTSLTKKWSDLPPKRSVGV